MREGQGQLEPGTTVANRYAVEVWLGAGGLAEVYRVRHLELGSMHALKLLTWRRKDLADRLLLEGRIHPQLRHPNVVAVTDVLQFDGQVGLLMEYVDGTTLDQLLNPGGALSWHDAVALFVPLLSGVEAAHDASTVDQHTDIFALAAILYEMLAGRKVFADPLVRRDSSSTLEVVPRPLNELAPDIEQRVSDAVARALSRDPEDHFPDCRSFAAALGLDVHLEPRTGAQAETTLVEEARTPAPTPRRPRSPWTVAILGLAASGLVGMFVAGIGGLWLWRNAADLEPHPHAAAAIQNIPKAAPVDAMQRLGGRWTGEADGRPFELDVTSIDGGAVQAEVQIFAGTSVRNERLVGTYDPASGDLVLTSREGGVKFEGRLSGASLSGTYAMGDNKVLTWSAGR